ncbi:ATP-dependent RNA helicase HrpB [Pseudoalteromonas holothuriae]|uniref:ATP-dependent RNA helicase HrpB n=1 Tax=Pseudoalteromonas holothuriae TaxID=2963714 RepID=A0A9W4QT92_9GAMM|nr:MULTISPECIES: ATP-dependent helicase HrpB [unclassified Pseudoalteromonas]CAH9052078.1 ATP-dependent RNA helicase HrpB [Pseudoalteromonas sp. CIP111854]CAH9057630.1 ATP-dependent RNA helicase HrpB [Pseudoalteromonas sp. CIP111951]
MLPIQSVYPQLVSKFKNYNTVLLQAPPGAGKSTWLPLQLVRDNHFQRIIMLEPRRLAARNIANFLSIQQQEPLGQTIGLRIRNEVVVSSATRLEIVTEGVLTRMLQADPELSGVDLVIFDEFHERSLAADTALAFALETQSAFRDDLNILVMSATLDSERYQSFLHCPLVSSQGRSYPVSEIYQPLHDEGKWLEAMPSLVLNALEQQDGSALVFLPGQREINYLLGQLSEKVANDVDVVTLFGEQDKATQQTAIAPAQKGRRKVVLTTNVAETSLTIEGIRVVVDCGKRRAARFNLKTGVTELITLSISRSSAVQRAGRAGRIEPGVVFRLGSHAQFERRDKYDTAEILCSDIAPLVLEAKIWGTDITQLPLLDKPTPIAIKQAYGLLQMLEILDEDNRLTALGQKIHQFGTDPRLAHMLIKTQELEDQLPGISALGCYFIALLESRVKGPSELRLALQIQFEKPQKQFSEHLAIWLKRFKLNKPTELACEYLSIVVALAFPDRLAKRRGQGFLLANGAGVNSHESLWLDSDYIAVATLGGIKGQRIFSATELNMGLVQDMLPHLFSLQSVCEFDEKKGRFLHEERTLIGALIVHTQPSGKALNVQIRTQAWLNLLQKHGLEFFEQYPQTKQLLIRMTLAQQFYPQEFKQIDEASLLANLAQWLGPFLDNVKQFTELKKFDLANSLQTLLDWHLQQRLEHILPKRIDVPSGSSIKVEYQLEGPAKLSVRMQEVYGLTETPKLCNGQLPLLMELLSPARRPLQLTQDLAHFWQTSYKEVQKEMKGRYPKHFWPGDPANAQATNKVKSKM